jgi:hypothetical protein
MKCLKAWRINDIETWAGRDVDEAIEAAIAATGVTRDELLSDGVPAEVSPDVRVMSEEGEDAQDYTSIGEILAKMTGPGPVCTTEW